MVKQGDILKLDLSPTVGHEQKGYRPVVVVSNDFVMKKTNMVYVVPVTNTVRHFPLHVALDDRTKTKGEVLCEQIKAVDLSVRKFIFVEHLPEDILEQILTRIISCLEIFPE
jgi:mRNA interferase MazF